MVLVIAVIAVVLVLVLGLLIFWLQRRTQSVVPHQADTHAAREDRVVAFDDQDRPVSESADGPPSEERSASAFEAVLREEQEEIHEGDHTP